MCSSHTAALSPVAGHNGFDLIQLSIANSPLFKTSSSSFSHLWRFLGSDTDYADTALALMDLLNLVFSETANIKPATSRSRPFVS